MGITEYKGGVWGESSDCQWWQENYSYPGQRHKTNQKMMPSLLEATPCAEMMGWQRKSELVFSLHSSNVYSKI